MTDVDAAFAALSGLQSRPGQRAMARAVAAAVETGRPLLVHAPTGVGKSLGYLVPLAAAGVRVTVATATKALQAQLLERDLPRLTAAFGTTGAIALGRANYYCKAKGEALLQATLTAATPAEAAALNLVEWAASTETGSRTDAPPGTRDDAWDLVATSGEDCPGARGCALARVCFAERAREQARQADVVVTNHHLLLLELQLRDRADNGGAGVMLPEADVIVIDEAHRLADHAADLYGVTVRGSRMGRAGAAVDAAAKAAGRSSDRARRLRAAWEARTSELRPGALVPGSRAAGRLADGLAELVNEVTAAGRSLDGVVPASEELEAGLLAAKRRVAALARDLRRLADALAVGPAEAGDAELAVWVEAAGGRAGPGDRVLRSALVEPGEVLRELLWERGPLALDPADPTDDGARRPAGAAGDDGHRAEGDSEAEAGSGTGGGGGAEAGSEAGDGVAGTADGPGRDDDTARTGDAPQPERRPGIVRPVTIACSATLAVGGSLDAAAAHLGVDDPMRLVQPSPYDFERNALLYVPDRFPAPSSTEFLPAVQAEVRALVEASAGRALVLATAWRMVPALAEALAGLPYELLVQGEDTPARLAERFRAEVGSVLVGTRTFFEGIDVPGESLSLLVLDKLPFPPPDDPLLAERGRRAERRGRANGTSRGAFQQVWLPAAAVSLQQALGRLIRSERDRGVMAVLDRRLADASYGAALRSSLPPAPLTRSRDDVRRFLEVASTTAPTPEASR